MIHPNDVKPMKAKKGNGPPVPSERLVMQLKLDGWRMLAHVRGDGDVDLRTSTGEAITSLPYIERRLARLPVGTVLDGEIVDLSGAAQWNRAQKICSRHAKHEPTAENPPLTFVVFDALEVGGEDLRPAWLSDRMRVLSHLLPAYGVIPAEAGSLPTEEQTEIVRTIQCIPATVEAFDDAVAKGWEGVVVKDLRSPYREGSRRGWTKYKGMTECDALCTGTYEGQGRLEGWGVGGVCFTVRHEDGTQFNGRCAGMDDALRRRLHDDPSIAVGKVIEIRHWGAMEGGALRFPQLRRIRDPKDKSAAELGIVA